MYIHVKVQPGAKREEFKEVKPGYFSVLVREKAERNMANGRVIELIAKHFGVSGKSVRIVSGHRSQSKILDIITKLK